MRYSQHIYIFCLLLLLLCGCSKKVDLAGDTNDDSPVPIMVGAEADVNVMSKAAVTGWEGDVVGVFGMKWEKDAGFDFTDANNIVDYQTSVSEDNCSALEIFADKSVRAPYFYEEGYAYHFFGYHLGGASVKEMHLGNDLCAVKVGLSGSNDLMYAYTDPELGLVYSASAARKGYQPKLIFEHALSRFIFIAKGMGNKYDMLEILGLEVKAYNAGVLTFWGGELGFKIDENTSLETLSLLDENDEKLQVQDVVANTESVPLGGEDACIMIPAGMADLSVNLLLRNKINQEVIDYEFVVNAKDIENQKEPMSTFQPGLFYMIYINIYGPEEILIFSSLDKWDEGGDFEVDPDDDNVIILPDDDMGTGDVYVGDYEDGGSLGDMYY